MKLPKKKICAAWKSKKYGADFLRRIASALLCVVLLGTNTAGAFALEAPMTDELIPTAEAAETTPPEEAPVQQESTEAAAVHITAWTWMDEENLLTQRDGQWYFVLEGEEPENLTGERLKELLPGEVRTTLSNGDVTVLPLTWDISALCFPLTAGEAYPVSAALGGDYSLADGVEAPKIFCTVGDAGKATALPEGTETPKPTEQPEVTETPAPTEQPEVTETPAPTEQPETTLCAHHPAHDESCGYTEENPVCSFVCAVCSVQRQVDDILARVMQMDPETEELDEEATLQLYDDLLAVFHAYNLLEQEQREQITDIEILEMVLEALDIQPLAEDATMEITKALIRAENVAEQDLSVTPAFSVDFSKQFTLHIEVKSTLNLANKKLKITVPEGLTVVEYPIPERGGMAEGVTPESIDQLNGPSSYGGYRPKTGTITYSLKNTAEKNSFNIILAPDTVLWNRRTEQILSAPLTIEAYTDGKDAKVYQTVSATATITGKYNDTAGDNRAIQTGPRLSRVGVKSGVPTAANQPFALRQIWLNPDKDYIDMAQYFKKLEITIALPYYTKNGSNVYAEFDQITFDPAGQSDRPNLLDPKNHGGDGFSFKQEVDDVNHTVTLTWENLYLEYGQDYLTPYFKWTSGCDDKTTNAVKWGNASIFNTGKKDPGCYEGKTPTAGDPSAVGGTITWQDDSTWYIYNGDCTTFSFTAHEGENMSVNGKANDYPIYNNTSDSGIIYYLGQFHVVNQGGATSAPKTVEFTYEYKDKIGVTAQKIPATDRNTVTVDYTTTDGVDRTATLTSSGGFALLTAPEGEYITHIKADVGSYEKDYVGYVSSRAQDPTSGYATTFGKLLTNETVTYTSFATMKMYDTGTVPDTSDTGKEATYDVRVTAKAGEIPPGMEQAYDGTVTGRLPILSDPETGERKTTATAGETITFNGLLSSSAYPYSSNNIMTDPEIYIRLPDKITVKNLTLYREVGRMADKVFLLDAVTETVIPRKEVIPIEAPVPSQSPPDPTSGTVYNLYKITPNEKVGWFTDTLGQYQIGISFDMEIAKDAEAMTLDMRDCVRFKSGSIKATSNNGTLSQYQVKDTHDMNGNGNKEELFSTFNVNAAGTKLSVVAARLGLTFTFGARMAASVESIDTNPKNYSNYEVDGEKVYLKDDNHVVDMCFTLKNETGREFSEEDAQAFYYFIPVPKKDTFWDSHMQDKAFEFDMTLTEEPKLSGASASRNHIQVTYSTDADSTNYSDTRLYEETIGDLSAVRMIRIAATPDTTSIPKDAYLQVRLRLKPEFDSNAELVGKVVNFGPCGVSPYSVGVTLNQGHNPLPRIQVEFQTGIIAGQIFLDKNFNGVYDDGDELYRDEVTVEARHQNGPGPGDEEEHITIAKDGKFSFASRRADTYHVIVTNPGSPDLNGTNPMKFSLPASGVFSQAEDGTARASIVLDSDRKPNDISTAGNLMIGLQQPHTVTFEAVNASLSEASTRVWHEDELGTVPTVTANAGWRFTGNWTDAEGNRYSTEELETLSISEDTVFTAEVKKLYSLTYELNGGSGTQPQATQHIEGESVPLVYPDLKKGEAIFAGWSLTRITDVLQEDAAPDLIDAIITADELTMLGHDVTLYAVYAKDGNGNKNPDFNDDSVQVRYHGNNNEYKDVICPHHHVVGGKAALSKTGTVFGKTVGHDEPADSATGEAKEHKFIYGDNIFLGWSTAPILNQVIGTKAEYETLKDSIKTEVTMLAMPGADGHEADAKDTSPYADADGNTNVYAVWAADRNGNKTPDYQEERTLSYDGNAQQGGSVTGVPGQETLNADGKPLLSGDKVTLNTANKPTHDAVDGKDVVFLGWTARKTDKIYGREDDAPVIVSEVTIPSGNVTVYAAWGYDENNNSTGDVLETYTLSYNLNGGTGTVVPADVTGLKKWDSVPLTTEKGFTRNPGEVFAGWSRTQFADAFQAGEKDAANKVLIQGDTVTLDQKANLVLYAVWAADANGNGTADYDESYRLSYDGNAQQNGTVTAVPTDSNYYVPSNTVTLAGAPAHTAVNGKTVLFLGWTAQKTDKIYSKEDSAPTTISEVAFTENSGDVTVYAAWGYDANNNGTADCQESHRLVYDGNELGGTVTGLPTDTGRYISGDKPTLSSSKPTHDAVDGKAVLFLGWTAQKTDKILDRTDTAPDIITEVSFADADVTVYAAWGYDANGNGRPDYEECYKLIYEGNAQPGDSVTGEPTDASCYIPGDKATLSSTRPAYTAADGKAVLFLGWTAQKTDKIYSMTDAAPTVISEVSFAGADVTVYAAWGYDANNNGTPDTLETYSLRYDLNGGTGTKPADVTGIRVGSSIPLAAGNFTRNPGEVFVGWSRTQFDAAFTAEQEEAAENAVLKTFTLDKPEDTVLYAVWAVDADGDGTADYQPKYTVTYDLNGGRATGGENYDPEQVKPGTLYKVKAEPRRAGYTFGGWVDGSGNVYQAGQELTINADLKLTARWNAVTFPGVSGGVRTGDTANMALWLSLSAVSVAGLIAVLVVSRRQRKNKRDMDK